MQLFQLRHAVEVLRANLHKRRTENPQRNIPIFIKPSKNNISDHEIYLLTETGKKLLAVVDGTDITANNAADDIISFHEQLKSQWKAGYIVAHEQKPPDPSLSETLEYLEKKGFHGRTLSSEEIAEDAFVQSHAVQVLPDTA